MEFRCNSCGFRFESGDQKKQCPYCGKKGSIHKTENAEELMRELDG